MLSAVFSLIHQSVEGVDGLWEETMRRSDKVKGPVPIPFNLEYPPRGIENR